MVSKTHHICLIKRFTSSFNVHSPLFSSSIISWDMVLCSKRMAGITLLVMDKGCMSFFNDIQCMLTNVNVMIYEWMQLDVMYFFPTYRFTGPRYGWIWLPPIKKVLTRYELGFANFSQSHRSRRMFVAYDNYMPRANSFKGIYFERCLRFKPYVNYILWTRTTRPSFLVGEMVKGSTNILRVIVSNENIEACDNYMTGDNIFKGYTLSEVLVPTLKTTTSRGPVLLNLLLSHFFTLDLGKESFPQGFTIITSIQYHVTIGSYNIYMIYNTR